MIAEPVSFCNNIKLDGSIKRRTSCAKPVLPFFKKRIISAIGKNITEYKIQKILIFLRLILPELNNLATASVVANLANSDG